MSSNKSDFLRDARIWDFVARNADDEIARGGWRNSYNGEFFSIEEMSEYAEDVYIKLHPYMDKNATVVLEIGCASGITMYKIAPYVKKYIGTDMAAVNLGKNEIKNQKEGITNIELYQCEADEIIQFKPLNVNVIIINSVVQYFKSENYLLRVIECAGEIIKNRGVIYVGDVRDKAKRSMFEQSVLEYYRLNHIDEKTIRKVDELFLDKSFFIGLKDRYSFIKEAKVSDKVGEIQNELLTYRFDAILEIEKDEEN